MEAVIEWSVTNLGETRQILEAELVANALIQIIQMT